jgi:hypothetical protein
MQLSIYDLIYQKELHEGHKIIYVLFNNMEFVFRTLTRKEYKDVLSVIHDDEELEDAVCQVGLIYPEDMVFAECPIGGLTQHVSPIIIENSGFNSLEKVIEIHDEMKEKIKSFDQECMNVVKAMMPEYTYDQMEDWTWEKLMNMVARAERVAYLKGNNINLTVEQEEVNDHVNRQKSNNKDFIKELRENGIDPMFYFKNEIVQKQDLIDFPLIGGIHWRNEGILDAIRSQMDKKKTAKQ